MRLAKTGLLVFITICFVATQIGGKVEALILQNRSVTLTTTITSATSSQTFQFTIPNTDPMGSIVFEYCENSPIIGVACTAPAGLNVQAAILTTQTGNPGFIIHAPGTTANKIVLTRSPSASSAVVSTYVFDNITNPSTANSTTYIRISTHVTANGSGAITHNGSVAFATQAPFSINTIVPPFLELCVAISVAADCSVATGNSIDLGNLSTTSVRTDQSQFAVGTNSTTGYIIFSLGTTMTSGNNTITALTSPTPSFPGNSQFGINLRANTVPVIGANPDGSGSGSPTANYNTPNLYMFKNGDSIATATLPTDYRRMTVSYVVNVNKTQPPGIYSSTYTYLATANF